ncbi:MAG: hypothetical protein KIT45_03800 [Fimbriimonadia bacterium]|nr:hypothetical protein [Fimbriimonadia bacterium]
MDVQRALGLCGDGDCLCGGFLDGLASSALDGCMLAVACADLCAHERAA